MLTGRPFTGAWIETNLPAAIMSVLVVAPSRGRGSKLSGKPPSPETVSRPFTGAWIETEERRIDVHPGGSPLHGGVDRNFLAAL